MYFLVSQFLLKSWPVNLNVVKDHPRAQLSIKQSLGYLAHHFGLNPVDSDYLELARRELYSSMKESIEYNYDILSFLCSCMAGAMSLFSYFYFK